MSIAQAFDAARRRARGGSAVRHAILRWHAAFRCRSYQGPYRGRGNRVHRAGHPDV